MDLRDDLGDREIEEAEFCVVFFWPREGIEMGPRDGAGPARSHGAVPPTQSGMALTRLVFAV